MNSVQNNPFRIIGIPANAPARDIQSRKSKIQAFTRVGKDVPSEYDFPFFEKIDRDEALLSKAYSHIEHNNEKVLHSLFWFTKVNSFDEMALKYLENDNPEKAKDIWKKIAWDKEVSASNWSAVNNICTLLLWDYDDDFSEEEFHEIINSKVKLIRSDLFNEFILAVADQTYSVSPDRQVEVYLEIILKELTSTGYSASAAIRLFDKCDSHVKAYVVKGFTADKIVQIEHELEIAKKERDSNPGNSYQTGKTLHLKARPTLDELKGSLGDSDSNYQRLAESLAKELRQSGITYFNKWQESKDPSKESMELLNKAYAIAVNKMTKDSIIDNYKGMQEFAKNNLIKDDLEKLAELMSDDKKSRFNIDHPLLRQMSNIPEARNLINEALVHLQNVKAVLKQTSEIYMIISTNIAAKALDLVITTINNAQIPGLFGDVNIEQLKGSLENGWKITQQIEKLDMQPQFHENFLKNKNSLKNLCLQLNVPTPQTNYAKIPQLSFVILESEITNVDQQNKPLLVSDPLYQKFTRFVGLNLKIKSFENQNFNIFVKYVDADGKYSHNSKISPVGYTRLTEVQLNKKSHEINLVGWGNSEKCSFNIGRHTIEVYVDDFKIYKKDFEIAYTPSELIEKKIEETKKEYSTIENKNFLQSEIIVANRKLNEINQFKIFRSASKKQEEITEQQRVLDKLKKNAQSEKESELRIMQAKIDRLKQELTQAKY